MNQYIRLIFPDPESWNYLFKIDLQFVKDVIVPSYLIGYDKFSKTNL